MFENNIEKIKILAIESSCDETSAAVVVNGREMKSNVISTQIPLHTLYGGVVPEIASRAHIERINQVIEKALEDAGETFDTIDAVAVTKGPGLVGSLLIGVSAAKAIAWAKDKPLIGVNHIAGHVAANFISNPDLEPPFLCLIVSGGHTTLTRVLDYNEFEILGQSVDDAAGEAFDKVARAIGLGYPGGPKIQEKAKEGDANAIQFPVAKVTGKKYDFSFSGLKSAVLNYLNSMKMKGEAVNNADIAASFQKAVVSALVGHAMDAVEEFGEDRIAIAGGVSANSAFRKAMEEECAKRHIKFYRPDMILCTDNAAMIGAAAYYQYLKQDFSDYSLNAEPGLKL